MPETIFPGESLPGSEDEKTVLKETGLRKNAQKKKCLPIKVCRIFKNRV
jgi:hypothetical protein